MTDREFILAVDTDDEEILRQLELMMGKMKKTLDDCRAAVCGRTPYVITQERLRMERLPRGGAK